MALQVYLDPCTINCRKVLAGLDLIKASYNIHFIDYFAGKQKSPEYLKINPGATIPAATHDDIIITESNAILQYAADLQNSPAYPKDLKTRAQVNQWLLWETSAWFPSCYVYMVEYIVKPLLKASPDKSITDAEAPKFHKLASVLDAQLAKTKWVAGNQLTIADIAVASSLHIHAAAKMPLDEHPNIKRWYAEMEKLPEWQKTQGAVEKALLPDKADGTSNGTPDTVNGSFNYSVETSRPTELYFYESPAAANIQEPGLDPHTMPVHSAWSRNASKPFSEDVEGFSLKSFHSTFDTWEDESVVKSSFYPEVVAFLKQTIGAKSVLVFDHTIRTQGNVSKKLTQETNTSQRAPVMLVHCDYTAESGPVRVRQLLKSNANSHTLLKNRYAFINVWKPIRRVVEERPLAMCDVGSAPPSDFFKLYLRYRDRNGENYVMRHSDRHHWWYFPKMTPEQVILLKTFDSAEDGRARFVGHSAFEDPSSAVDAPVRESVEIRTIAFF